LGEQENKSLSKSPRIGGFRGLRYIETKTERLIFTRLGKVEKVMESYE